MRCEFAGAFAFCVAVLLTGGCRGSRALDVAGEEARQIAELWWVFFFVALVVYALVLLFLGGAIWRGLRRGTAAIPPPPTVTEPHEPGERRLIRIVAVAVGATIVTLFTLLLVDFSTHRALRPPQTGDALTIKVTGRQWWWEIEYQDRTPSNIISTANELHLPLGRPVQLILNSADVIHSFWLPSLAGKRDLIPGKGASLWLRPERTGVFRGQCAEFCGYQHAHMGLLAVVESPEDFARWQEAQRKPAPEPGTENRRRGRDVFMTSSCVLCHTISGTPAGSRVGPTLTHFSSRQMIAANAFPNNRGYLAGWILDPQALKPGARMPQNQISSDDLQALLDYLESLQ
jgi:cytochrome c oxidase subunit II